MLWKVKFKIVDKTYYNLMESGKTEWTYKNNWVIGNYLKLLQMEIILTVTDGLKRY